MTIHPSFLDQYALDDRYRRQQGRIFLTGTQALVRILLDQARRDRKAGLNTAGFVSGYRGSPLGGLDGALWKAQEALKQARVEFLPAVNEDLAATAVLGTQSVESMQQRRVDGVFAMWYGKGPGVDRSGDALKHGNAYGSSPHGGVLVVVGDDHGCVSSSMSHQSDAALLSWFMPVLHPANVAEYLEFGEYGYALSRFSGAWVGFKAISEIVESAASVTLRADRNFARPDFTPPADGLHYRWPDLPGPQIEERLEAKKHAIFAFAEANPIDRHIHEIADARFGIITTGKAHLDLMEALRLLGVDEATCRRLGIDIYKVGMVWPLARRAALDFVRGKQEVLVIEEKRGIIESQLKEYFYDWPGDKPARMVGKRDENGQRLVPWTGELSPRLLAPIVAARLDLLFPGEGFAARARALSPAPLPPLNLPGAQRTPYFCSGCPHNTSTRVPEGSRAQAGIGCHVMASWMNRNTGTLTQMGGEGVNWVGACKFTDEEHVFQNLGEGTWYHSGSMAVRQAVAAGANITFKILYNDAVAMTGGQPVDGPVSVQAIAHASRAEGVRRIAVVSDMPETFHPRDFPADTTFHHRRDLDPLQRELRQVKGVSVLIYVQTCAAEKRRRRKCGLMADIKRHVIINEAVCDGCGDCSVASNCLSVEPVDTPLGRKRRINQSSCNKDFTCLDGFCPAMVTVEGERRKASAELPDLATLLKGIKAPELPALDHPFDLLVTGVGGTGVVTVGALITMAAHLEGKGSSVLDFTGFAQKFGPVLSYVRLADRPELLNQPRIDQTSADALIGCDAVVSASPKATPLLHAGTRSVLNTAEMPTGEIVLNRDASLHVDARRRAIMRLVGDGNLSAINANRHAETWLGDAVFSNVIMLGLAWQKGLVPVSEAALRRAIELNGVAVERNQAALSLGRILAAAPERLNATANGRDSDGNAGDNDDFDHLLARLSDHLEAGHGTHAAARFRRKVADFRAKGGSDMLARIHARALFHLMATKDEYEVARLLSEPGFEARLAREFEPGFRVNYHLAPEFLPMQGRDARGRPRKRRFGPWLRPVLGLMARMRWLRETPFDPFRFQKDRREDRALLGWYDDLVARCVAQAGDGMDTALWAELLAAPLDIRGFGPVRASAAQEVRARVEERLARHAPPRAA